MSYLFLKFLLQGVMVRLMLVLAPVMCILSGVAVSNILRTFVPNMESVLVNAASANGEGHTKRPPGALKSNKSTSVACDLTYPFKNQVIHYEAYHAASL